MQYSFGSGVLFGTTLVNNVPTPVRFGALQGASFDIAFSVKELFGLYQFPLALGRGTGKITGKADFAQINAQAYNDLFFGLSTPTDGNTKAVVGEALTVAANIVTVSQGANFASDQGVVRASDGSIYTRVANTPVGLQYTLNTTTGVYTFNSSQNNVPVSVSYAYNSATGKKISITNQLLGNSPQFSLLFTETFNGKQMTITLNAAMSSKLTFASKLEDFMIPSFDFQAFADASGTVGEINTAE